MPRSHAMRDAVSRLCMLQIVTVVGTEVTKAVTIEQRLVCQYAERLTAQAIHVALNLHAHAFGECAP